jgi:UDP-glucose 4-epimerase
LVEQGDEVVVIDDLSGGSVDNLSLALDNGAALMQVDVRDHTAVQDAFAAARPARVFHLAAQTSVRRSTADPVGDAAVNVGGTLNVLEASRRCGVGRFVNASTGGPIYGADARRPTSESQPPIPKSPYGASKLAAERYCRLYSRAYGVSTLSLRLGNIYGPRQDPHGEAGVVAIFCGKLADGRTATIFGDGRQERDFVYVGDVVAANLLAARSDVKGALNVGTGTGTSILDLARTLGRLAGRRLAVEHAPPRPGEVGSTALDAARAAELLGWRAEVPLGDGLLRTLESHRPGLGSTDDGR